MFLVKYVIIFCIEFLYGVICLCNCGRIVLVLLWLFEEIVLVYCKRSVKSCSFFWLVDGLCDCCFCDEVCGILSGKDGRFW